MAHLKTLLTSNNTKDLIIKTEGNDIVVIVNKKIFLILIQIYLMK